MPSEVASACASVVLPTPGMSSISRWPRASRQVIASRIWLSLPRMMLPTWATTFSIRGFMRLGVRFEAQSLPQSRELVPAKGRNLLHFFPRWSSLTGRGAGQGMSGRPHKIRRSGKARAQPARKRTALRGAAGRDGALQALRESEERFRAIFEQAAVGLTRVDLDGMLVDFNQKFCDMLGYTRAELLGKTIRDITHSVDYGQGSTYRAELVKGAAKSRSGEKRFVRKDGTIMWARRTMSAACDDAGQPQYVISVVEDISESKSAEERYRATFDSAPIGIMHTSIEDDRILHANP